MVKTNQAMNSSEEKDKGKRQEREEVERSERIEGEEEEVMVRVRILCGRPSFPGLLAFGQGSRKYIL